MVMYVQAVETYSPDWWRWPPLGLEDRRDRLLTGEVRNADAEDLAKGSAKVLTSETLPLAHSFCELSSERRQTHLTSGDPLCEVPLVDDKQHQQQHQQHQRLPPLEDAVVAEVPGQVQRQTVSDERKCVEERVVPQLDFGRHADSRGRKRLHMMAILGWMLGLMAVSWILIMVGWASPSLADIHLLDASSFRRAHGNLSDAHRP